MSLARPMLFVHCRAHRRLRANTSGKIQLFSGCYYSHRYRLQLFRTATARCSCTPRNLNLNRFWKKCFRWHNSSLGRHDRDGGEQTTSLHKTGSPSKVFMCGMSTQKWPSNQITMFERTRQSAWFDAVTTPLTRSEWTLVYKNTSFWRKLKKSSKNPGNALSDAILMSCFQNFAADAALHPTSLPLRELGKGKLGELAT